VAARAVSAQRRKLVEFFRGHDDIDPGRSLRVSLVVSVCR